MRKTLVCYSERENMGDLVNPFIFSEVLDADVTNTDYKHCDISGIGSGLRRFFVEPKSIKQKARIMLERQVYIKPVVIWSAGFMSTPTGNEIMTRKNMRVTSVRGELSKQWVQKLIGKTLDCTTGDGGLLASELLLSQQMDKKYPLGIIPHDKERGEIKWEDIQNDFPGSVIIDVRGDVMDRLKTISQCECIISSSLHGLIFADSFHVPNRRVVFTDRLSGDGFKFKDYYSAYGINEPVPIDINTDNINLDQIKAQYNISADYVEQKKEEIKKAFWRFL